MTNPNESANGQGATEALHDENKLIAQRREKLAAIRAKRNAFPNDFRRSNLAGELVASYGETDKETLENLKPQVKVAGRLIRMRGPFLVIQDVSEQIQLYFNPKELSEELQAEIKGLDLGDIVGVEGRVFRTGKGELTVWISHLRLLTKSLRPLPDKYKGLSDTEVRYRQRYIDLIANESSRETFVTRSRIISSLRRFFEAHQFMEVETPMMQVIPGGASAKPFITHHNALDQQMYLRIAPELYLKRLVVGGFERVFEINRNFRNEGLSTRHNPEFTMVEFYQAYADYKDLMDLTENLFRHIGDTVFGRLTFACSWEDKEGHHEDTIDLSQPFRRIAFRQSLVEIGGVPDDILDDLEQVKAYAKNHHITLEKSDNLGKLWGKLFDHFVETTLVQPTFIIDYPLELSPLSKKKEDDPSLVERFELFVGRKELANAYTELNDPIDQKQRFEEQVLQKEAGDDEAHAMDSDFIRALEYGLPPTAGEGIGIDRLVMMFTNAQSIRDVIFFPQLKKEA